MEIDKTKIAMGVAFLNQYPSVITYFKSQGPAFIAALAQVIMEEDHQAAMLRNGMIESDTLPDDPHGKGVMKIGNKFYWKSIETIYSSILCKCGAKREIEAVKVKTCKKTIASNPNEWQSVIWCPDCGSVEYSKKTVSELVNGDIR